ncbi:hypothetical protein [Streptomyces sp. NPDC088789]|uniref:hypothetical protein n=1 Tax=Streptomyces sp. NPDC088789 TaxID=3365899 RepID=UPI0037FD3747
MHALNACALVNTFGGAFPHDPGPAVGAGPQIQGAPGTTSTAAPPTDGHRALHPLDPVDGPVRIGATARESAASRDTRTSPPPATTDGVVSGAVWAAVDEVLHLPAGPVGYGEWGVIDLWRRPKPEFWLTKKAFSPVRITDGVLSGLTPGASGRRAPMPSSTRSA